MSSPPVAPGAAGAKRRLASLDALRGFDMLWLVGGGPLLLLLCEWLAPDSIAIVRFHCQHAPYGTSPLRAHDLVMPLFLFMAGVAMAFSGPWAKPAGSAAEPGRGLKVLRRTAILWLLGMAVQGNLLGYDPSRFIAYSNTLQAIAAGGLIAELVALLPIGRARLVAWLSLPLLYRAITALAGGGYDHDTNVAIRLDDWAMGLDRGDRDYAWILPSLNFGFTVILGAYAGRWLRRDIGAGKKTLGLAGVGLGLLLLATALAPWEPINKHVWTGTFSLWAGAWSLLLLALFHGVIDAGGCVRWTGPLRILGTNALVAYLLADLFSMRPFAEVLFGQAESHLSPPAYASLLECGTLGTLGVVLAVMHRHRIVLKL